MEEVKEAIKVELQNEDVFMAPVFSEFTTAVILCSRGGHTPTDIEFKPVEIDANNMKLKFPCQLFINGEFVDSESGKTLKIINPTDESLICEVNFKLGYCDKNSIYNLLGTKR